MKLVDLFVFITKKFVTMHGHMNFKKKDSTDINWMNIKINHFNDFLHTTSS